MVRFFRYRVHHCQHPDAANRAGVRRHYRKRNRRDDEEQNNLLLEEYAGHRRIEAGRVLHSDGEYESDGNYASRVIDDGKADGNNESAGNGASRSDDRRRIIQKERLENE